MKRLTQGSRAPRRAWLPLLLIAGGGTWLAWPAPEGGPEVVEAVRPHRTTPADERTAVAPSGYARRLPAEISATNLFASHSWFVAPPPPPPQKFAPPVPTAPALPYTFLGSYARAGEPAVFFLVKGDRIFDARIGDVLDKQYSVDAAENGQLRLTYLPLGIKQSLAVGGTP